MQINPLQVKRKRIPFFAPWASFKRENSPGQIHELKESGITYERKENKTYANHVEMAGFKCAGILSYGHDEKGILRLKRHVVFPMLRLYPNDTHSSLDYNFKGVKIFEGGEAVCETVERFVFNGCLQAETRAPGLQIFRMLFTARSQPCFIERLRVINAGEKPLEIFIKNRDGEHLTEAHHGNNRNVYRLVCQISNEKFFLQPGESAEADIIYGACNSNQKIEVEAQREFYDRMKMIEALDDNLQIETPNKEINAMLRYAKIRAGESIFKTKNGFMHSPGGGGFYAALWTNDQCEYVNPLFGYLGFKTGFKQAVNCYRLYERYVSSEKPLITSIIAEGDGVWHGAGDRGDSAMYAYGLSRFLLSSGDRELALSFLQPLRSCIEFTLSQKNNEGVICSDSDELENRFESGNANLCTSCLAYDALCSCSFLENEIGSFEKSEEYRTEANALRAAIESYFGRNVEGFETYRYCEEEVRLRSWICLPLSVGISERAKETAEALLSPKLRMKDGLVTRSGEKTFWDRSTLYALRGMFYSGESEKAFELLQTYTNSRLLGRHIPYAVEACPEGNQAQLSAESGLYVRAFTEGIFGYRPTGFNSFELKPSLPGGWEKLSMKNFTAHNRCLSIDIKKTKSGCRLKVFSKNEEALLDKECEIGEVVSITMK